MGINAAIDLHAACSSSLCMTGSNRLLDCIPARLESAARLGTRLFCPSRFKTKYIPARIETYLALIDIPTALRNFFSVSACAGSIFLQGSTPASSVSNPSRYCTISHLQERQITGYKSPLPSHLVLHQPFGSSHQGCCLRFLNAPENTQCRIASALHWIRIP